MTDAKPYTKEAQLARGPRKHRRKVASPSAWARIWDEKVAPCRICFNPLPPIHAHHLIPRDWHGDDVADNIVALCLDCHHDVHLREPAHCRLMLTRLTDAEYAYAVGKAGEAWAERIYGIEYER